MPRPKNSTFNTTGFTKAAPSDSLGFSQVPTSPYRSDGETWDQGAQNVEPDMSVSHMGFVRSPERLDAKGNVVHKSHKFRIRVACEHWATDPSADDCRYGCEAKAQVAAFVP